MRRMRVDSDAFDAVDLVGRGLDGLGGPWTWREQPRGAWDMGMDHGLSSVR